MKCSSSKHNSTCPFDRVLCTTHVGTTIQTRRLTATGDSCGCGFAATGSVGVPTVCMASWACSQLCSPAFAAAAAAEDVDGSAVGAWLSIPPIRWWPGGTCASGSDNQQE